MITLCRAYRGGAPFTSFVGSGLSLLPGELSECATTSTLVPFGSSLRRGRSRHRPGQDERAKRDA